MTDKSPILNLNFTNRQRQLYEIMGGFFATVLGGLFAISLSGLFEIVLVGLFTKNTQLKRSKAAVQALLIAYRLNSSITIKLIYTQSLYLFLDIGEAMRLVELFEPQKPTPKKRKTDTVAEVFIIESLELVDENKERREGAVLASVLKMCGKNPLYYYTCLPITWLL